MDLMEILTIVGGLSISTISYFLKKSMDDLKEVKNIAFATSTKIQVLESNYLNKVERLEEKFDMLYKAIEKLTEKLENLQNKI